MDNLSGLWDQAASSFPGNTAVIHDGVEYSYEALDALIRGFSAGLRDGLGMRPGDRVALVMPNCLHSIVCYLGAVRAGVVALPVNIRLKPEEMRFILQDAGARALVAHEKVWATVDQAMQGVDSIEHVIGVGKLGGTSIDVSELRGREDRSWGFEAASDDVAAIIYTSGTTGLPKGAMITHGNVLFNVQATIRGHGFRPEDLHTLIVPLFHVTGLNTIMPTAFHQGASLLVTDRTDPAEVLPLIEQYGATTFFGVPTTMILLAQAPGVGEYDLASLRLIAYSGAPMPVRTIQRLRELFPGVKLHNFFGLTETTSVTTVLPDEQALERPESVGKAAPGLETKIVDEEGRSLNAGQVGELLIRGPSIVKGYYNRLEATAEAIVDGWLHTGDTAFIDEEGYVFLQGRQKEMIIVAGENVYPVEVENVLTRHGAVAEAAVIGQPHSILGEVVKAVIVLRPGMEPDEQELKRFCVERLASFKVPQSFELRASLPRNPSGKVVKRRLRQ